MGLALALGMDAAVHLMTMFQKIRTSEAGMIAGFALVWVLLFFYTRAQGLVGLQPGALSGDPQQYSDLAVWLVREGRYSLDGVSPFFEREPGYSLFLAIIYLIAGVQNFTAVSLAQAVVHVCASFLFVRTTARFLSQRAALLLLGGLLFFPAVWHVIFSVTRESLSLSLTMFFVASMWRLKESLRMRDAVVTGLLLGALSLTYTTFLLFPFFLIAVLLFWRVRARLIVIAVGACIAVMIPWAARNYLHTGMPCMTGCYRAALQWYVRGEQAEHIRGMEPLRCLWAEYVSRDWSDRSPYCSLNAVWHRKWPEGFVGVPQDAVIARESQQKILQYLPYYLWFSLFEVLELHLPYVNGWGRMYNLLAAAATVLVYGGIPFAWPWFRRHFREGVLFLVLIAYNTGIFALTDATPRYLVPLLFAYTAISAIGYDWLLSRILHGKSQYRDSGIQ